MAKQIKFLKQALLNFWLDGIVRPIVEESVGVSVEFRMIIVHY